jgi:DNA-binding transcriptional MerR regulator
MEKSADAFRTISEVAEHLATPAHVLRFWESRFPQIKPVKRAGGRRYYRPSDVALLEGIKRLLHSDGVTIRGVQKILREQGVRHVAGLAEEPSDEEVALEVALADIDVELPAPLDAPAAEEATVTVLQDAVARMRGAAPATPPADPPLAPPVASPDAPPDATAAQPGLWDAPPPAPAALPRDATTVEVPAGPTLAARLRARKAPIATGQTAAMKDLAARLAALRDRMLAAGRPGGA